MEDDAKRIDAGPGAAVREAPDDGPVGVFQAEPPVGEGVRATLRDARVRLAELLEDLGL